VTGRGRGEQVLRNGQITLVDAKDLVPGDIVEIAVGDKVPADVRLLEMQSTALKVEQAALTGEAASVNKNALYVSESQDEVLVQKENTMFAATDVVYGKCKGVVVKTGSDTEIGKIAKALTETEDQDSPLKEKVAACPHTPPPRLPRFSCLAGLAIVGPAYVTTSREATRDAARCCA
jgi:magnesium-transporting ATPase (P-type)